MRFNIVSIQLSSQQSPSTLIRFCPIAKIITAIISINMLLLSLWLSVMSGASFVSMLDQRGVRYLERGWALRDEC